MHQMADDSSSLSDESSRSTICHYIFFFNSFTAEFLVSIGFSCQLKLPAAVKELMEKARVRIVPKLRSSAKKAKFL